MNEKLSLQYAFVLLTSDGFQVTLLTSSITLAKDCSAPVPKPKLWRYMVVIGISLIAFLASSVNGSEDQYQMSAARVSSKQVSDYSHWIQENAVVHSCWLRRRFINFCAGNRILGFQSVTDLLVADVLISCIFLLRRTTLSSIVLIQLHIREVFGSNIDMETDYYVLHLSWFYPVSPFSEMSVE